MVCASRCWIGQNVQERWRICTQHRIAQLPTTLNMYCQLIMHCTVAQSVRTAVIPVRGLWIAVAPM